MDVMKLPTLDPILNRPDAVASSSLTSRLPPAPIASPPAESFLSTAAALADQVQIHPLDLTGAMQIMIAEVRAELPLPGEAPNDGGAGRLEPAFMATGALPAEPLTETAPQTMVQWFLQALPPPEMLEPAAWLASVMQIEVAVHGALDRAVEAATAWRDVASAVVDGARETRAVVVAAIADDPPNPLWLRPEWLGLAPRMERYRRQRRRVRRWLSDPDLHWRERDEDLERKPPGDERP